MKILKQLSYFFITPSAVLCCSLFLLFIFPLRSQRSENETINERSVALKEYEKELKIEIQKYRAQEIARQQALEQKSIPTADTTISSKADSSKDANKSVDDAVATNEPSNKDQKIKKPTIELPSSQNEGAQNIWDSPLGEIVSNCLKQELAPQIASNTSIDTLLYERYEREYKKLILYEHFKFKVTQPEEEPTLFIWQKRRERALSSSLQIDQRYQQLIKNYQAAKIDLEVQLKQSINPPSLQTIGCKDLFFTMVQNYIKESAEGTEEIKAE